MFLSSDKVIKKFDRYLNKNQENSKNKKGVKQTGLTAEQIRKKQEVRSGGNSTTSRPIGQKQSEILGAGLSNISGGLTGQNKTSRRNKKPKEPVNLNAPIIKVNFTATPQTTNQESSAAQVN